MNAIRVAATVVPSVQESLVASTRTTPSTARTWIATETVPVITAPSPSPRVVRRPFSATSSGLSGGTMNMGAGMGMTGM